MRLIDAALRRGGWRLLAMNSDPLVWDRSRFAAAWLLGPESTVKTLDAGCGNGAFAFQAARVSGGPVLGVSDDHGAITKAVHRAEVMGVSNVSFRHFDLRRIDQLTSLGRFNQIILFETVEHVLDDAALVRSLAACLEEGGRLLLTTPSHDHAPLFGEGRHLSGVEDGRHVRWGYSAEQLQQLVRAAGLEPAYIQPISGVLMRTVTSLMWRLSTVAGRPFAMLATAPLRLLRPLDRVVTHVVGLPSHCWGIVAVRPRVPAGPGSAAHPRDGPRDRIGRITPRQSTEAAPPACRPPPAL
jgi:SAM-dependent methyltransferase